MNDTVSALFQGVACVFLLLNIATIMRDREFKGMSVWTVGFFTVWTLWGAVNWFILDQYWSYVTSVAMTILYIIWLALIIAVKCEERERQRNNVNRSILDQARDDAVRSLQRS